MTVCVNLYGGPGTGKSTTAALVFGELKKRGVETELVTEFAKDLVWENRGAISCQPYVFGKQLWRLERLRGKVDVIVTDSPLLLSVVYAETLGPHWIEVVKDAWKSFDNLDVLLLRDAEVHPYSANGRYQATLAEAELVDAKIFASLLPVIGKTGLHVAKMGDAAAEVIAEMTEKRLKG